MPLLVPAKSKPAATAPEKKSKAKSDDSEKKPKKEKKEKKDNGPKRPKTAQALFAEQNRKDVESEENVKGKELTSLLKEKWDALDANEKKKYEDKAKTAKATYEKDKKKWEQANPERMKEIAEEKEEKKRKRAESSKGKAKPKKKKKEDESEAESDDTDSEDEKPKKKKAKKDPNAPKKPMSSFLRYSKDVRASVKQENPKVTPTEIAQIIGAKWKALSEEAKAPYVKAFKEAQEAYKKAKENDDPDDPAASEEEEDEGAKKKKANKANGIVANGNGHANGNGIAKGKTNGHASSKANGDKEKPKDASAPDGASATAADAADEEAEAETEGGQGNCKDGGGADEANGNAVETKDTDD